MRHSALLALVIFVISGCGDAEADSKPTGGIDGTIQDPAAASIDHGEASEDQKDAESSEDVCIDHPCYGEITELGVVEGVEEPSGVVASRRTPGRFYVVSDIQDTDHVAVIEADGTLVAEIRIDGMSARDAEALAVGPCGDQNEKYGCLFIGDIGNHVGLDDLWVYRVPEPDLQDPPAYVQADALRYTYPGEPTDAEAMLVDSIGRPIIISNEKATFDPDTGEVAPPRVFRGPADGGPLEYVADLELPYPQVPIFASRFGHVVTGADSMDRRVLVRTYDEIYEFRTDGMDADLASFSTWPIARVPTPFQVQSEAVAYRVDECGYISISEFLGSIHGVSCLEAP